jgi:hypothetical protein
MSDARRLKCVRSRESSDTIRADASRLIAKAAYKVAVGERRYRDRTHDEIVVEHVGRDERSCGVSR